MTLKELKIGESAVIDTVGGTGELRQHFLDMGLIPGEKVTLVKFAPMGDPMELQSLSCLIGLPKQKRSLPSRRHPTLFLC